MYWLEMHCHKCIYFVRVIAWRILKIIKFTSSSLTSDEVNLLSNRLISTNCEKNNIVLFVLYLRHLFLWGTRKWILLLYQFSGADPERNWGGKITIILRSNYCRKFKIKHFKCIFWLFRNGIFVCFNKTFHFSKFFWKNKIIFSQ